MDNTQQAKESVQKAAPDIRDTLLNGVANGIAGLKSTAVLPRLRDAQHAASCSRTARSCTASSTATWACPSAIADVVTANVAQSLRSYFLGVTIIAAFNAVVIGVAALILGVPLAGTIAVVTFVGAYVPFVGAWVAGAFAVLIALGTEGTDAALAIGGRRAARQRRRCSS